MEKIQVNNLCFSARAREACLTLPQDSPPKRVDP